MGLDTVTCEEDCQQKVASRMILSGFETHPATHGSNQQQPTTFAAVSAVKADWPCQP